MKLYTASVQAEIREFKEIIDACTALVQQGRKPTVNIKGLRHSLLGGGRWRLDVQDDGELVKTVWLQWFHADLFMRDPVARLERVRERGDLPADTTIILTK